MSRLHVFCFRAFCLRLFTRLAHRNPAIQPVRQGHADGPDGGHNENEMHAVGPAAFGADGKQHENREQRQQNQERGQQHAPCGMTAPRSVLRVFIDSDLYHRPHDDFHQEFQRHAASSRHALPDITALWHESLHDLRQSRPLYGETTSGKIPMAGGFQWPCAARPRYHARVLDNKGFGQPDPA